MSRIHRNGYRQGKIERNHLPESLDGVAGKGALGPAEGRGNGGGTGRDGSGSVITSKSKRIGCIGLSCCQGPFQPGGFREKWAETRKPPGWAALGWCYGRTILGRRVIPTVPKSRRWNSANHVWRIGGIPRHDKRPISRRKGPRRNNRIVWRAPSAPHRHGGPTAAGQPEDRLRPAIHDLACGSGNRHGWRDRPTVRPLERLFRARHSMSLCCFQ